MATNRWRVIWGYMDANGNIVEEYANPAQEMYDYIHWNETEFHPSWREEPTTNISIDSIIPSNAFSNYDTYNLQAQGYANQWDNAMANAYGWIANNLWRYSSFANNSLNAADALLNYVKQNEAWLQWAARWAYNTILWDLQNQRDYINSTFWPEWSLTKEVNTYYDDLWNYLATDAWRQAARIAAQWVHSWASLWSIRAQQNEAYNESFWRYIQAKEQQINAKLNIATNLINFMTNLRKEYWDTTNQYVIDLYKRANDLYNTIAQNTASDIDNYNKALATPTSGWGSWWWTSSTTNILNRYNQLKNAWMTDDQIMAQLWAEWYIAAPTATSGGNNIETNNTTKQTTNKNKWTSNQSVWLWDVAQAMLYLYPAYLTARWAGWLSNRVTDMFK